MRENDHRFCTWHAPDPDDKNECIQCTAASRAGDISSESERPCKRRSWISENTSIVKVDRTTGKMTAGTKTGTAAVTITLRSGLKKTIRVIVQKMMVRTTKLTGLPSSVTVSKGKTVKLTPVRTPVTSQEKVTYTIRNKTVASVTSNGVVKGRKNGKTNLTVQSGARRVTVLVIVTG